MPLTDTFRGKEESVSVSVNSRTHDVCKNGINMEVESMEDER